MNDLFGVAGTDLLDRLDLPGPYAARITSLRRLIEALGFEIDHFAGMTRARLAHDPGYRAVQTIPGIGPILAAVFVAEIGDINRSARPRAACLLGRADPQASRVRHPRAPWPDHQTGLPPGPLGRRRIGQEPAATAACATGSLTAAEPTSAPWPQPAALGRRPFRPLWGGWPGLARVPGWRCRLVM